MLAAVSLANLMVGVSSTRLNAAADAFNVLEVCPAMNCHTCPGSGLHSMDTGEPDPVVSVTMTFLLVSGIGPLYDLAPVAIPMRFNVSSVS